MATQHSVAVRDNSTLTNFKQWAQIISNFMATIGWSQTADLNQVNWGTIAAVPGISSYVFEIWKPGDALTAFYLKIEYGTQATAGRPSIRLSVGTSTDGTGNLSGLVTGLQTNPTGNIAVTSTTIQYDCYLSGDSGRVNIAMWVDDTVNQGPLFFCAARSKNSSGANTSAHVSLISCGSTVSASCVSWMQTIVFGVAVSSQIVGSPVSTNSLPCIDTGLASDQFNTGIPISPIFPYVNSSGFGGYDNPLIECCVAATNDVTDQATFTIAAAQMPYGTSHTYIAFRAAPFTRWGNYPANNNALVMLWE